METGHLELLIFALVGFSSWERQLAVKVNAVRVCYQGNIGFGHKKLNSCQVEIGRRQLSL